MRLIQDHSFGAAAVSVPCFKCGRMVRMVDTLIDLDGPAFQAYYHKACAPVGPVAPCPIFGCQREHAEKSTVNNTVKARGGA
jgi:hypothetical protein